VAAATGDTHRRLPGAAWLIAKETVTDGFETVFQFRISDIEQNPGDGFAFVIQIPANLLSTMWQVDRSTGEEIGRAGPRRPVIVEDSGG
jgi:hypothetical protein